MQLLVYAAGTRSCVVRDLSQSFSCVAKDGVCMQGPSARLCHPREEHLLPLMVAAGAAGCGQARVTFDENLMGAKVSGYIWD